MKLHENKQLFSEAFLSDFKSLLEHDRQSFDKPEGWQSKTVADSPLKTNLHEVWSTLQSVYLRELPDLAYKSIPDAAAIVDSISRLLVLV